MNIFVHLSNFGKKISPEVEVFFYGFVYAHNVNVHVKTDVSLFLFFSDIAFVLEECFPT